MSIGSPCRINEKVLFLKTCFIALFFLLSALSANGQTLPYAFSNNSTFVDEDIYVAIVGITDGHVWIDAETGSVNPMSVSDNTIPGPVIDGNIGPGNNGLYADCFTRLSDIPEKTVHIPKISGCRIYIAFQSQLYFYFFGSTGSPSGYAAPNPANPTDPNQGIRYEIIELTYNDAGLWCNTTRVDAYQYPMGLEVWGENFYKKVGELKTHDDIVVAWQERLPAEFQGCLNRETGIIRAPSKIADFQEGGVYADYMQPYIDAIWEKYKSEDLIFTSDAGIWKGRVEGERFVFHNTTNFFGNATGIISARPNTQEAWEGKGVLAEDVQQLPDQQLDLVVQAQVCAALTRHTVDLNSAEGITQDWSDNSKFYQSAPCNYYSKFWHESDISYQGLSYGFCYDDVYGFSSTVHTPDPTDITITIGGFAGMDAGENETLEERGYLRHLMFRLAHHAVGLDLNQPILLDKS